MIPGQMGFWFIHATRDELKMCLAVAAFTERSAKVQARKALGPRAVITAANPVCYAHAWFIDMPRTGRPNL